MISSRPSPTATAALAAAVVLILLLGLGGAAAKTKHKRKPVRAPAVLSLNETPVQSGAIVARPECRRKRYVEIRRAGNDALVASATTAQDGRFRAAAGYSGPAYAFAQAARRAKTRCLAARSPLVSVGVADLRLRQAAVASGETGGHPAYDITVFNAGPDAAQSVVVVSRPVPQLGSGFGFDPVRSSPGCSLGAMVVTCRIPSVYPGQAQTRRIALTCSFLALGFRNTATASSSARDPATSSNTSSAVPSSNCG